MARVRTMLAVSYPATRRLIVVVGLVVLLVLAVVLYVRRVDPVEVVAVLLFLPVFLAFVVWRLPGGLVAGALAAVAYAALRAPAMEAVGGSAFSSLVVTRGLAYLAFGALGGWAESQLQRSIEKLDVYDQIDDETGLFNARFFLQATDLEMSRAVRYKTLFSVAVVDVPSPAIDEMPRRRRAALLADLGHALREAVRSVDRVVHGRAAGLDRFAVVCPETGPEGASVFTARLAEQIDAFLRTRGAGLPSAALATTSCTYPGDDEGLAALRSWFAGVEQAEHPEHPQAPATRAGSPR